MNEFYANYNWKPITNEFRDACKHLEIGELLKESTFGLFEAMSAIEMMDPKMDAGLVANQSKCKIRTIQQAIENKVIKIDDIENDEKLAIIDNTLCHLTTWLDGTSLAQTVFTNIYLHNPNLIEDKTIKWFSITILKIVDSIRNKILNASVFEEEDFQSMHYNFKFSNEISEQACVNSMKTLEDETAKHYRHLKSQQNDNENAKLQVDLASSLLARIKFTRAFYQLLLILNDYSEQNEEEALKYCNQCKESLRIIETTHNLGVQPKLNENSKSNYPIIMGFEPSFNQRLLPPTFPRYIRIHKIESTINEFIKIIDLIQNSLDIVKMPNFNQIFEFMLKFGDSKPSILNRSITQLLKFPKNSLDKLIYMKEFLKNTSKQFIEPPALQTKCILYNKDFCKQLIDNFFNKCSPIFITLLQIMGHNRARQREKLAHILEEFSVLQDEADNLDRILHSYLVQQKSTQMHLACFGSWILYNSLTIMISYILFGFDLELYSIYELHYIYWYLSEVLFNWLITTLNRVDNYLQNAAEINSNKINKKSKKKLKSNYDKELSQLYAHRQMCSAYYQILKVLKTENKITEPNEEFNDEELRYEHRFMPFQLFNTPQMCHYKQFKEKDDQFQNLLKNTQSIYKNAQEFFEQAKNFYEELADWNNSAVCAKIAKTNFVVMRLLASGLKKIEVVDLDFSQHPFYPIIRI